MKLTPEQIAAFDKDGYLFFPSLFTPAEIKSLTDEVPRLYAQKRPENIREKGSDAVRTNFAAHLYSKPFAKLARHPRMVEPVARSTAKTCTCTSSRSTARPLQRRRLAMAPGLRHLDERRPHAGSARDERRDLPGRGERVQRPAHVHPRQPQAGRAPAGTTPAPPAIRCGPSTTTTITKLVRRAASSRPRAAGLDDPLPRLPRARVHVEPLAVEPRERVPQPVRGLQPHPPLQAPGYIAHRDFTPIVTLPDDCLLRDYDVALPWKDGTPAVAYETEKAA
jgi:ectoine hydroxylase